MNASCQDNFKEKQTNKKLLNQEGLLFLFNYIKVQKKKQQNHCSE